MRVQSLDGKWHVWSIGKYIGRRRSDCSTLHERARDYLLDKYPAIPILEEVHIPGENLYLDFYIPAQRLAIECQGKQHSQHTAFFHKSKKDFLIAKARDNRKSRWCELNNVRLILFYPEENEETWEQKLNP